MIDPLDLDPPPVGVRLLASADELAVGRGHPVYHGISYCDAVRRAGQGETLRLLPGSIQVCQWSPIVLGLATPASPFEAHLAPRLDRPVAGLLLSSMRTFPGRPQVILIRATPDVLRQLVEQALASAGPVLWAGHDGQMALSVVPFFEGARPSSHYRAVQVANEVLARLARSRHWRALTYRLFRSRFVTELFDAVISHTLADMSMCRNSTAIPLLTGQVNLSFFCSGGLTWGLNDPDHLTSGWPWALYRRLQPPAGEAHA